MDHIEQEIQAKGLTAPRITLADIEAAVAHEFYIEPAKAFGVHVMGPASLRGQFTDDLKRLTLCIIVLRNGFTVTGESSCASPENFDADLGRKIARQDAINQCWPLLGYELRSKLAGKG